MNYPENVSLKIMTFNNLREFVLSKFDFNIALNTPYKLCDYKPAYGYIFENYLQDFRFWGHCDIDMLIGNLSKFVTEDLLCNYDKLFCLGHMTLYKNTYENNRVFMSIYKGEKLYRKVFSTNSICWFDEEYKDEFNINRIFKLNNKQVFEKDYSFNVNTKVFKFIRVEYLGIFAEKSLNGYNSEKYIRAVYIWDKGSIYRFFKSYGNHLERQEFLYIHLQSRKMNYKYNLEHSEMIKIIPNTFQRLEYSDVTIKNIDRIKTYCLLPFLKNLLLNFIKMLMPKLLKNWLKSCI